jgi:hypothetical protein
VCIDCRLDDREDISTAESDRAQAFRWRWRRWNFGVTTGGFFSPALEQQLSGGFSIVVIPVVVAGAVVFKNKPRTLMPHACCPVYLFIYSFRDSRETEQTPVRISIRYIRVYFPEWGLIMSPGIWLVAI